MTDFIEELENRLSIIEKKLWFTKDVEYMTDFIEELENRLSIIEKKLKNNEAKGRIHIFESDC